MIRLPRVLHLFLFVLFFGMWLSRRDQLRISLVSFHEPAFPTLDDRMFRKNMERWSLQYIYVCVWERERACVREYVCMCVCVCVAAGGTMRACVCVCVWERQTDTETETERHRENCYSFKKKRGIVYGTFCLLHACACVRARACVLCVYLCVCACACFGVAGSHLCFGHFIPF